MNTTDATWQIHPAIRDECRESSKCKESAKHFSHCTSKVEAGEGFKGEDCVEELFQYELPPFLRAILLNSIQHDALC